MITLILSSVCITKDFKPTSTKINIYKKKKKKKGFPGGSACNAGDLSSIPGLGRPPGGGHGNPLQDSYLENPHGQRSLAGYSPWGHKESDITEQLSTYKIRCLKYILQDAI